MKLPPAPSPVGTLKAEPASSGPSRLSRPQRESGPFFSRRPELRAVSARVEQGTGIAAAEAARGPRSLGRRPRGEGRARARTPGRRSRTLGGPPGGGAFWFHGVRRVTSPAGLPATACFSPGPSGRDASDSRLCSNPRLGILAVLGPPSPGALCAARDHPGPPSPHHHGALPFGGYQGSRNRLIKGNNPPATPEGPFPDPRAPNSVYNLPLGRTRVLSGSSSRSVPYSQILQVVKF